jgi:ABC-2 type transport system permease protein
MSGAASTSGAGQIADSAQRRARKKARGGERQPRREKIHYTALDPTIRAPRHGWRIVAGKEFADLVLSLRFLVLVVIMALVGAAAVYATAGQLGERASAASGVRSLFLLLYSPPSTIATEYVPPFTFVFGLIGPLLGILFGFDAVNGERAEGTLPRLLSQPIHRDDVINGKFVAGLAAIGLVFAAVIILVAGIGIVRLGVVPDPDSILRLMVWWVVAVIYVGFWLAFALLCSVLVRRAAASGILAFAVWFVLTLFGSLLVGAIAGFLAPVPADATTAQQVANLGLHDQLARLAPSTLFGEATAVLLDPTQRWTGSLVFNSQLDRAVVSFLSLDQSLLVIWPQVVALVALTVVAFAGAYVVFMRQEVRA